MATKSGKSSGTQHNARGATQGTTLVGPQSGLPIDEIVDSNGKRRLAVDANFVAQNVQANVNLDSDEDEVAVEDPDTGAHIRVELDGSINANVEIDAADGDNIAIHDAEGDELEINPDGSINNNLRDEVGTPYSETNPLNVTGSFEKFFGLVTGSKWMDLGVYDEITPTFSVDGRTMTLAFKEDSALIGEAVLNYNSDTDWSVKLNRYITEDDNDVLLDDNDSNLNLD